MTLCRGVAYFTAVAMVFVWSFAQGVDEALSQGCLEGVGALCDKVQWQRATVQSRGTQQGWCPEWFKKDCHDYWLHMQLEFNRNATCVIVVHSKATTARGALDAADHSHPVGSSAIVARQQVHDAFLMMGAVHDVATFWPVALMLWAVFVCMGLKCIKNEALVCKRSKGQTNTHEITRPWHQRRFRRRPRGQAGPWGPRARTGPGPARTAGGPGRGGLAECPKESRWAPRAPTPGCRPP